MATLKQIDANRRNSQLSTGPRTPEGKQRAAANALQSGIYAESEIIFTEDSAALENLQAEYQTRFQPDTPEARDLVDSLVRNAWLLRRLAAAEASLFNCPFAADGPQNTNSRIALRLETMHNRLDLLQRRINSTERHYHRALKAIQTLVPEPRNPQASDQASDPQPHVLQPTSDNLASFLQIEKKPGSGAAGPSPAPQSPVANPCLL